MLNHTQQTKRIENRCVCVSVICDITHLKINNAITDLAKCNRVIASSSLTLAPSMVVGK